MIANKLNMLNYEVREIEIGRKTVLCGHFKNKFHSNRLLEELQSLRNNEDFCDIRLKTDDNTIIFGHKIILGSSSPYFYAMFSSFGEKNKDIVHIKELDSTALQLIVDYIYTGEIIITDENVQVLLPAANFLQFDYVSDACVKFLEKQINSTNCLSIKAFADLHNCLGLLSFSQAVINEQFVEVVKGIEFLSLSCENVIEIISCDYLIVPYEEKIFESVIKWVKHDLDSRKDFLPELMEHVRLPLLTPDMLYDVANEPLFQSNPKCKDLLFETLNFHLQNSVEPSTNSQMIRCKPRSTRYDLLNIALLMINELQLPCNRHHIDQPSDHR